MNEPPKPKTNRGWRIVRRILIAIAVLATLVAIFYTEEDWRGKRAWESYKREMEAKGEKFDWQAFVLPAVPDDQNFFKAPIVQKLIDADGYLDTNTEQWKPNTNTADRMYISIYGHDDSVAFPTGDGYWWKGTAVNLAGWQQYYRALAAKSKEFPAGPQAQTPAADVLLALSKYDSAIEELREAGQRPDSWIPLDYDQGMPVTVDELLPRLATFKRLVQVLQLRSIAEIQNGESEKGLDDIELMFRLNDSIRSQPFLIAHLVRIAIFSIAMQPIWEGLVQHRWTDKQLATLDDALAKMDFLQDYELAMRGETAFAVETIENERITREFTTVDAKGTPVILHYNPIMPNAYFYRSEMAHAQMSQQWAVPLVDINRRIVSPETLQRAQDEIRAQMKHISRFSPYKYEALMTAQAVIPGARRFAIAQTGVDLGRVACALERYRLAHGQYPETLDALAPQFIDSVPHDIINGQPLHYRLTTNGKFLLYSVGWNAIDDGGQVVLKNGSVDYAKGDWVWQSAAK